MNIDFIHVDNKAIISDENGNKRIVPYYDNLHKVLLKENAIEELEEKIKKILKDENNLKGSIKQYNFPYSTCILSLVPSITKHCLFKGIEVKESFIRLGNTDMSISTFVVLTYTALSIVMGLGLDYLFYRLAKENNYIKNANSVKLEYLKKELDLLKKEKTLLDSNKTNSNIQHAGEREDINIIDNNSYKKHISDMINLYNKLGYQEKKLYKLYLKEELNKIFDGEELEIATKFFEEKEHTLAKKYNK